MLHLLSGESVVPLHPRQHHAANRSRGFLGHARCMQLQKPVLDNLILILSTAAASLGAGLVTARLLSVRAAAGSHDSPSAIPHLLLQTG